jgi:hypothetical protein
MRSQEFLAKQLKSTAEIMEWVISLFTEDRLNEFPPHKNHPKAPDWAITYLGEWSALRVLFHLVYYEEVFALPSMRECIGESKATLPDNSSKEEEEWIKGVIVTELLERFRNARDEQIAIVTAASNKELNDKRMKYFGHGKVSISWLVTKTIQHTFDHGGKLLRKALYWDDFLNRSDKKDD